MEGFIPNERTLRKRLFHSMNYETSFIDFCCTDLRWKPSTSPFPFIGVPDIVFKSTKPIYIGS